LNKTSKLDRRVSLALDKFISEASKETFAELCVCIFKNSRRTNGCVFIDSKGKGFCKRCPYKHSDDFREESSWAGHLFDDFCIPMLLSMTALIDNFSKRYGNACAIIDLRNDSHLANLLLKTIELKAALEEWNVLGAQNK
jgi:hypothetical protein